MSVRFALVTGGTGFTGSRLVQALVRDGRRVRVLARSAPRARAILPAGVEVIEGDVRDPSTVDRAVAGVDWVFHIAAAYREAKHPTAYYYEVNVEGTRLLLEAACEWGVRRFVHCSTIGVLSHVEHPPADETAPHQPGDAYQSSKSEAEKLVLAYHRERGLPVSVARPTAIYGPGDTRFLKMFRLIAKRRFPVIGPGDVYFHMVHVNDLVAGLCLLAEHPRAVGEVFILGGEEYLPLRSVFELIAEAVGASPPRLHLPVLPVVLAAAVCEALCVPFGIEPPLHRRRVAFFSKSRAFSIQKAKRLLGYQPRMDVRRGIVDTAEWYAAHGLLKRPRVVEDRRAMPDRRRTPRAAPARRSQPLALESLAYR